MAGADRRPAGGSRRDPAAGLVVLREPVRIWPDRDQAWLDVVQGLRAAIAELRRTRGESQQRDGHRPRYPDDESRRLSRRLKSLFKRRKDLTLAGDDTVAIETEILDVRRLLRKGPQLRPGEFLGDGRYELIEAVGQGGFATVWKAWDGDDQRPVALKVLHGHYSEDRGKRERFFRGARKMAELAHPHIVRVLDIECADDGWHFFVMEYLSGGNLEQAVLRGELTAVRRLEILLQAGEALDHAHRRGAVHRDVKPSNILLSDEEGAKLTDFDLVRAADTTGLTATRAMLGTIQFAAPEALESAGEAGFAADVYSLGSTAVFAFAGGRLPPWYYRDPARAIARLDCGAELKRVLERATLFEERERCASVAEMCQALGEAAKKQTEKISETASLSQDADTRFDGSSTQIASVGKPTEYHQFIAESPVTVEEPVVPELGTTAGRDSESEKRLEFVTARRRWSLAVGALVTVALVSWVWLRPLWESEAWTAEPRQELESVLQDWVVLLAVLSIIWLIFYKGLYPIFLRYFRPDFCKFLFWSLFLLYSLAWLHLSLYILFEYGYWWLGWMAVFLTALWLICFAAAAITKSARAGPRWILSAVVLEAMAVVSLVWLRPLWKNEAWTAKLGQEIESMLRDWLLLLAVFALIWLVLYKGLYPIFLRYFRPDFCKFLFWSLFFLYGFAWLHLSLYILFEYGYWYPWMRWVAVFLTALWLIWFAVVARTKRA